MRVIPIEEPRLAVGPAHWLTSTAEWRSGVEAVFLVRLWYLKSDLSLYRLDDDCTIIRVTRKELAQIPVAKPSSAALSPPSRMFQMAPGDLAVKVIAAADSYERAKDKANHKFLSLIRALRLLKPTSPYIGEGLAYQPGIPGSRREYWASEAVPFGPGSFSGDYEFTKSEGAVLRRLYRAVSVLPAETDLAFRRFDMMYGRELPEDRLIDCWVALEALFLPGIDRGELSYRASLRAAYYVGTKSDRQAVFWNLRDSYEVRSAVVHGEKPHVDVSLTAQRTEDVLRRVLRKAVLEPNTLDMTAIDNDIVGARPNVGLETQ